MGIKNAMALRSAGIERRIKAKSTPGWEREWLRDGWVSKNAMPRGIWIAYETIEGKLRSGYAVNLEEERKNVGEGWQPIITKLHDALVALDPDYRLAQIKEKFGGLRYYIDPSTGVAEGTRKEMSDLTYKAEEESLETCEICGKPGAPRGSWVKTLCPDHAGEREKRKVEEALLARKDKSSQ